MSNDNKSRGFKQAGFSYPGTSPFKGKKKDAEKLEAKNKLDAANAKIEEFGEMEIESKDLMDSEGFSITGGGLPTPIKKYSPMKEDKTPDRFGGIERRELKKFNKDVNSPTNTKPGELKVNKELMETKVDAPAPKSDGWAKKALSSDIGGTVVTSAVNALIGAGINAITKPKKEKKSRRGPDVSGFSRLKFGRS